MAIRKPKSRARRSTTRRATSRRTSVRRVTRKASPRNARTTSRGRNGGSVWSRADIAFMRKNYRTHSTAWCARQLGRTVYSVRYKASDLSIKKAKPSVWKDSTPSKKRSTPRSSTRRFAGTTRRSTRRVSTRRRR